MLHFMKDVLDHTRILSECFQKSELSMCNASRFVNNTLIQLDLMLSDES